MKRLGQIFAVERYRYKVLLCWKEARWYNEFGDVMCFRIVILQLLEDVYFSFIDNLAMYTLCAVHQTRGDVRVLSSGPL